MSFQYITLEKNTILVDKSCDIYETFETIYASNNKYIVGDDFGKLRHRIRILGFMEDSFCNIPIATQYNNVKGDCIYISNDNTYKLKIGKKSLIFLSFDDLYNYIKTTHVEYFSAF